MIGSIFHDLRFGFRMLRRNPGFAAVALLSLAVGIGANTSLFSVLHAVLYRDLPVLRPEQLVLVRKRVAGGTYNLFSTPAFQSLQKDQRSLEGLLASGDMWVQVARTGSGQTLEKISGRAVSRNYFTVLGAAAQQGRVFAEGEQDAVAVISHRFWERQFARDSRALGASLTLDGISLTIIGITPPAFFGETPGQLPDLFVPLDQYRQITSPRMVDNPGNHWLHALGRLKPGTSAQGAAEELQALFRQTPEFQKAAASGREPRVAVEPGSRGVGTLRDRFSEPLGALMALAGLLLLIACCNVANLLLARAAARQREIGIRAALGASRQRLLRQLLTEGLLLSTGGGMAALWMAMLAGPALVALASDPAHPIEIDCRPDWQVFWFNVAVLVATAFLFALIPALQGTRRDVVSALKAAPGGPGSQGSSHALGRALIAAQVALSLVLLSGAGLLVRTLANLKNLNPGFQPENVVLARITFKLTPAGMEKLSSLAAPISERVAAIPGVQAFGLSTYGGLARGHQTQEVSLPDRESAGDPAFRVNFISSGYFDAYGIKVLAGRAFQAGDTARSSRVVILNQSAARLLFGSANPIGRRLCLAARFDPAKAAEVVGLVRDAKYANLREEMPPQLYVPLGQGNHLGIFLAARTAVPPGTIVPQIRRAVHEADSETGIADVQTLKENLDSTLVQERMMARLCAILGLLSLILAGAGIYGVIAYSMARRTKEFGIRMALGADAAGLLRMVLRDAALLVAAGAAVGVPAALAGTRFLESLLFGLSPGDPLILLLTVLFLLSVGLAAAYLPASRASRINPVQALRFD